MNVGDKVRMIGSPYRGAGIKDGCTGVIAQIDHNMYEVQPDEHHPEGELWPFDESELEVIQ
jgi:hypothetical protein